MNFNPLSLYRERLVRFCCVIIIMTFQSTLPIQGETRSCDNDSWRKNYFNPLSLYRERQNSRFQEPSWINFNPLSLYRERHYICVIMSTVFIISIHSPYTGRDPAPGQAGGPDGISIHSPYTGRDLQTLPIKKRQKDFNPLSLYRERPSCSSYSISYLYISIHSPYTGRDPGFQTSSHTPPHFNPLSLYRERPPGSGTT